jgi:imidazolonepropionase-like amidohydrolase
MKLSNQSILSEFNSSIATSRYYVQYEVFSVKSILKRLLVGVCITLMAMLVALIYVFDLPAPPRSISDDIVLQDVTIVNPMINKTSVTSLRVRDNKVVLGESAHQIQESSRYSGSFILPGLVNMHSHAPSKNLLNLGPMFSMAAIMHGVTTWRDALDADGSAVPAIRKQIKRGQWPTPNIVACALITRGETRWPNSNILNHSEDAGDLVKSLKSQGYGCIKSYENLNSDFISAIKKAATKHKMQVIGHVPEGLTIEQAGLPDTQHFFGIATPQNGVINRNIDWRSVSADRIKQVADHMVKEGMINTPTLVAVKQLEQYRDYPSALANKNYHYIPKFYLDIVWNPVQGIPVYRKLSQDDIEKSVDALRKKQALLKRLHDQGATLNLGTDTQQPFVVPGVAMWQEMRLFAEAGLTPEEVWAHGTWKAQRQLSKHSNGLIENGAQANFLIFAKDPTLSLNALKTLQAVVIRGKLYDMADLKLSMSELQNHYASWPMALLSRFFVKRALEQIAKKFTH